MYFKATIDRFENGKAVLKTEKGELISWPKTALPENIYEGSILNIAINTKDAAEGSDKELAKNILNEILDTKD